MKYLLFLFGVGVALTNAYTGLSHLKTTEELTDKFLVTILRNEKATLGHIMDADTRISVQSDLPYGGEETGLKGWLKLNQKWERTFKTWDPKVVFSKINEAKGISMVKTATDVVFAKTGKQTQLVHLWILEWNHGTGKIENLVIIDTEMQNTMDKYQTAAEKNLDEMMHLFFTSSFEDIQDGSSPLWNKIADDVKFKVHAYPSNILSKTEWNGKLEAVQAFKEMSELHGKSPAMSLVKNYLYKLKKNVLYSDEKNVWVTIQFDKHVHVIVHYQFNEQGQLVWEEIYKAGPTKLWMVYPWPMPSPARQFSALIKQLQGQFAEEEETTTTEEEGTTAEEEGPQIEYINGVMEPAVKPAVEPLPLLPMTEMDISQFTGLADQLVEELEEEDKQQALEDKESKHPRLQPTKRVQSLQPVQSWEAIVARPVAGRHLLQRYGDRGGLWRGYDRRERDRRERDRRERDRRGRRGREYDRRGRG